MAALAGLRAILHGAGLLAGEVDGSTALYSDSGGELQREQAGGRPRGENRRLWHRERTDPYR